MEMTLRLYRLFMLSMVAAVESGKIQNPFGIADVVRSGGEALSKHVSELPPFIAWAIEQGLLIRGVDRRCAIAPDALSALNRLAPAARTNGNGLRVSLVGFDQEVVRHNSGRDGLNALGRGFGVPMSQDFSHSSAVPAARSVGRKQNSLRPGEWELAFIVHSLQMANGGGSVRDYLVREAWQATAACRDGRTVGPALTRLCTEGYMDPLGGRGPKKRSYRLTDRGVRLVDKLGSTPGQEDASLE